MIRINLLPKKEKKKKQATNNELYILIGALCLSIGISGGVYLKNVSDLRRLETETANLKRQRASLEAVYREYLALEKEKKEMATRVTAIDKIKGGRSVAARLLYDLSSLTKDTLWLKRLSKNETKLSIEGRSVDNESICEFVERLSKLQYVGGIELKSVEDAAEGNVPVKKFTIDGIISL